MGSKEFFAEEAGQLVVFVGEAGALVEIQLVFEAIHANVHHLVNAHFLAGQAGNQLGHAGHATGVIQDGKGHEQAQAQGVDGRSGDLQVL